MKLFLATGLFVSLVSGLSSVYRYGGRQPQARGVNVFNTYARDTAETLPHQVFELAKDNTGIRLPVGKWVCTNASLNKADDPFVAWRDQLESDGAKATLKNLSGETTFQRMQVNLLKYFFGRNADSEEIPFTKPVTNWIEEREDGEFWHELCFWAGPQWLNKELPASEINGVYVKEKPIMEVFKRSFDGFALSYEDWITQRNLLLDDLKGREDVASGSGFYAVAYELPLFGKEKRNEVWIPRKEGANMVDLTASRYERKPILGYTTLQTFQNSELRQYASQIWACNEIYGFTPSSDGLQNWRGSFNGDAEAAYESVLYANQPASQMINRVRRYLAGVNDQYKEFEQSRTVITVHTQTGTEEVLEESQDTCILMGDDVDENQPPPVPIDPGVVVKKQEQFDVFARMISEPVISYQDMLKHYHQFKEELLNQNIYFANHSDWLSVTYDSGCRIKDRFTEIWIIKTY